jgi:hypothetical protein
LLHLSLLEVDKSGKKAEEVGSLVIDLAQYVAFDGTYSPTEVRKFTLNTSVTSASRPQCAAGAC